MDMVRKRGTPRAMPTWFRLRSLYAVIDAQIEGVHRIYRRSTDEAYCTCGLVVPGTPSALLPFPGHLDSTRWLPVDLFMASTRPLAPEVARRRYVVRCQRCETTTDLMPLHEASQMIGSHQHRRKGV